MERWLEKETLEESMIRFCTLLGRVESETRVASDVEI